MGKDIILKELGSGENYNITLPCVIGRGTEAGLSLPDVTISHRHALIEETGDKIRIRDMNSANGVFVNDIRIRDKTFLKPGDSIKLGNTRLQLSRSEEDESKQTVIIHSLGLAEEGSLDHQRLKVIYEITGESAVNHDVTSLGEKIFSKLREIFRQDRGYMASFQEDGTLKPLCLCAINEPVPLSRSIVNRLLESGESFLLEDALSDAAFREEESIMALKIRSAMCVPLIYDNQIYGLIYLDRNVPGAYTHEDLEFLKSIGCILAPLIENARLWSELRKRYADTVETLRVTEARLIETERTAAYVRLAHAMAHEIRNPMMVIGGMVRRISRSGVEGLKGDSLRAITASVERVEMVLGEVDSFVKIPQPLKKLERIDKIIREGIKSFDNEWQGKALHPLLSVNSPHVMIPLDAGLFKKALSMVFREILFTVPRGSDINIVVRDRGNDLEIVFGETDENTRLYEPFDPELRDKPWSLGLFLNIAYKILSDHGGRLLLDPSAQSAFPVVMRLPKTSVNIQP